MEDGKIVVTISKAIQIGMDEWQQNRISRVFAKTRPVKDMLSWAEAQGLKNPQISDLVFSEYTGESL